MCLLSFEAGLDKWVVLHTTAVLYEREHNGTVILLFSVDEFNDSPRAIECLQIVNISARLAVLII